MGRRALRTISAPVVWFVAVLCYIAAITARSSLAATGLVAAERFDAAASILSAFTIVQLVVYAGLQIPVGLALDRWGARRLLVLGALIMAGGQFALALADDVELAIAARGLVGAGDALTFVSVLRLLPEWFPSKRVPVLTQVTGMLGQSGQLVSVIPFAFFVGSAGWSPAFIGLAAVHALVAILALTLVRDRPRSRVVDGRVSLRSAFRGLAESWREPGTRLGFWCHFSTPFAGTVFGLLWGFPFLVSGEGLTVQAASSVMVVFVVANLVAGPVVGRLVSTHPLRRTWIVLGLVGVQAAALVAVVVWPGPAPVLLLCVFVATLAAGGPGSMIGFDFARTSNPSGRLGSASGIVNVGGFAAAVIALGGVGVLLDVQSASATSVGSRESFRIAMLALLPVWALGVSQVLRLRRRVRSRLAEDGVAIPRMRDVFRDRVFASFPAPRRKDPS